MAESRWRKSVTFHDPADRELTGRAAFNYALEVRPIVARPGYLEVNIVNVNPPGTAGVVLDGHYEVGTDDPELAFPIALEVLKNAHKSLRCQVGPVQAG